MDNEYKMVGFRFVQGPDGSLRGQPTYVKVGEEPDALASNMDDTENVRELAKELAKYYMRDLKAKQQRTREQEAQPC